MPSWLKISVTKETIAVQYSSTDKIRHSVKCNHSSSTTQQTFQTQTIKKKHFSISQQFYENTPLSPVNIEMMIETGNRITRCHTMKKITGKPSQNVRVSKDQTPHRSNTNIDGYSQTEKSMQFIRFSQITNFPYLWFQDSSLRERLILCATKWLIIVDGKLNTGRKLMKEQKSFIIVNVCI